jgi:capsular exopolysaccharide synthesis family protein
MSQDNRLMPIPTVDRALERPLSDLNAARSYGAAANEPTQLRDYLFVILKRKWLILSLCLVVTSLVAIQMFRQPSIYQAETTIRIEQRRSSVLQTDKLVITQNDPNFWGTQLKLLESPALARQVALTLDLQHNPAFFGSQSQGGFFAALRRMISGDQRRTKATPAPPAKLELVTEAQLRDEPLTDEEKAALEPYEDAIIGNADIESIINTSLFVIKFRHHDPDIAQKVANTLAEVFQNSNLERSSMTTNKQETTLLKEIGDLQFKVKHDTEVLFNYARENNLSPTNNPTHDVEGQRLASLSQQLLTAENDRKTAEAVYNAARNAQDPFTVPEVLKSEWISKVRNEMSTLKDKRDALLLTYTREWPEVKKIDATLKLKEGELEIAVKQQIAALKSKVESAREHEQSIRTMYLGQRGTTSAQTRAQIEMAAYTQKLETDKQYLNTLQQRLREIQVTTGDRGNEVSIENPSRLPKVPIGPARMRNVVIAFLLSLVAGIGLAFLLDFLDDTVKSLDDIDRYVHLPALALIPASRSTGGRLKGLAPSASPAPSETTALAMIDDVRSPVAESYRHLRTSLLLSSAGQPPKTILVTSSQPSEGKTTTGINTAFMLAQTGAEVLIIDCDLRRPRLHAQFEISNAKGLTTWLSGEKDLDGLLYSFPKTPNLKILTSGPVPPNPAELLGSDEMRRLLGLLSERFAHIIIDSPPAISFTDASILSTMVDGVMLVVHGGRSSRAVVRRAKQQLVDVGAHIFGVVLNNVRMETQDYYYSGYYSNYYSSADADVAPDDSSRETA